MNKGELKTEIANAIPKLLAMVEENCINILSENLVYIISEIKETNLKPDLERKRRIKENKTKSPLSFEEAVLRLLDLYDNLYDINLVIYKAEKKRTIIEIRYYPKSSLNETFRESVVEKSPMLHCKIALPIYHKEKKFDVNWEHNSFAHKWNEITYRKKLQKEIDAIKNGG